uniref:Borrelia PFam57/62 partition protein n=1 Tax=Borrelia lonestari TaxID=38876 RepID=A4ZZ12_9SPIR|nr:hypothetical protein [Borrelia lonestari]
MKGAKPSKNKYQNKLIVLISTLSYMNNTFKKYTQSDILYYFNGNLKRNSQKPITIKTLQNYLYKLGKLLQVTINYHKRLGVNMGTEIYYKLKFTKKDCHRIINKYFKDKKEDNFQKRVNTYYKKSCIKNGNVEKEECFYNIYNNKKEEKHESKKYIEKLQVKKYVKKCNFKSKAYLSIVNSNMNKQDKILSLKTLKNTENFFIDLKNLNITNKIKVKSKLTFKQEQLSKVLNNTRINLENEGYESKQLKKNIKNIYEQYKNKPHFIIEKNKYDDLNKAISKLKKIIEHTKKKIENEKEIRSNIFSILFDQLRHKLDSKILIPTLNRLSKQTEKIKLHSNFQ